jgi:hypothetical protein
MPDCVSHPVSCLNDVFQFIFCYHVLGPCLQVANIRRSCETEVGRNGGLSSEGTAAIDR